jgi:hypothetical protein
VPSREKRVCKPPRVIARRWAKRVARSAPPAVFIQHIPNNRDGACGELSKADLLGADVVGTRAVVL